MARKHQAVQLLKEGFTPSEIAEEMEVSISTVLGYLYNQVGEGRIRLSDIVFSIDQNIRESIERAITKVGSCSYKVAREVKDHGVQIDQNDLEIYLNLKTARVVLGDMYLMIRDIEVDLHKKIKNILKNKYGIKEWWRKGIPEEIRADCAASLERDPIPANEAYCYTNFIHLKEILKKQWKLLSKTMPQTLTSDRKKLLLGLVKLNRVRNSVMHPVRETDPTENDFDFVREFWDYLELEKWQEDS